MVDFNISQNDALQRFSDCGVGLDDRQLLNFFLSSKVAWAHRDGARYFNEANVNHVARLYRESIGKAYSHFSTLTRDGETVIEEEINRYQCQVMWECSARRAQEIIKARAVRSAKRGNEYYVPRKQAEAYRTSSLFLDEAPSNSGGTQSLTS